MAHPLLELVQGIVWPIKLDVAGVYTPASLSLSTYRIHRSSLVRVSANASSLIVGIRQLSYWLARKQTSPTSVMGHLALCRSSPHPAGGQSQAPRLRNAIKRGAEGLPATTIPLLPSVHSGLQRDSLRPARIFCRTSRANPTGVGCVRRLPPNPGSN